MSNTRVTLVELTCLIFTLVALAAAHPRCPDAGNLKITYGVASYARKYINNGRCPQLSYCRNVVSKTLLNYM